MKISNIIKTMMGLAVVFVLTLYFTGCGSNDETQPESLQGTYKFKSAKLTSAIPIGGGISIPAGTDISDGAEQGLFGSAPCNDPNNTAVRLDADGKLYFTCIGESIEIQAGTWSENSTVTELTLNLASPPLTSAISLKITDVQTKSNSITGQITSLPLPTELLGQPAGGVITVDVEISFEKVM